MTDRISIEFSREQYQALVGMIEIADWIINSREAEPNESKRAYREVRKAILAKSAEMGLAHWIQFDAEADDYFETQEYDEIGEHRQLVNEYDEQTFWDNLVDYLSYRDLLAKYGADEVEKMSIEERHAELSKIQDVYETEFTENGLHRLTIDASDEQ